MGISIQSWELAFTLLDKLVIFGGLPQRHAGN